MFKLLAVLSLVLVAVNAYDFSDIYFNQYLFEEYEFLNSEPLSRQRRDGEISPLPEVAVEGDERLNRCGGGRFGEHKKDLTCCDAHKYDPSYFSMIKDTKRECATKLRTNNSDVENFDPFNCAQMEKIKELIICESECVAKSLNILDEQGNIKRDAMVASFKSSILDVDDSKMQVLETYLDKCLNKLKDMPAQAHNQCNRAPMDLHHCLFGEMIVGCPAESQIKSPRCDRMRECYSKGEKLSLATHALHSFLHHSKRHGSHGKE